MLIEHWIQALVAVLGFAAVIPSVICNALHFTNHTLRFERSAPKPQEDSWYEEFYNHSIGLPDAGKFLTLRKNQELLKKESHPSRHEGGVDCCPSVLEMIEPAAGKNKDDQLVELYSDREYKQRFYELSCHKDIKDKPCRFMAEKLHPHSRCVQKYSYSYALVKDSGTRDPGTRHHRPKTFPSLPSSGPGVTWTLDYIRVRSGCACVVMPNKRKRNSKKHQNRRGHKMN